MRTVEDGIGARRCRVANSVRSTGVQRNTLGAQRRSVAHSVCREGWRAVGRGAGEAKGERGCCTARATCGRYWTRAFCVTPRAGRARRGGAFRPHCAAPGRHGQSQSASVGGAGTTAAPGVQGKTIWYAAEWLWQFATRERGGEDAVARPVRIRITGAGLGWIAAGEVRGSWDVGGRCGVAGGINNTSASAVWRRHTN